MKNKQNNGDIYLPQITGAIRSTQNRQTGFTPNFLMLGREIHQPIDLMLGTASVNSQEKDVPNYLLDLQNTMMETQNIARDHIKGAQIRQKKDYDSKIFQNSFEIGDVVLKVDSAKKTGQSPKLKSPWKGPYVVVEVKTPVLFKINDKKQKDSVIHHDRLKLCQDREHPIWVKKTQKQNTEK